MDNLKEMFNRTELLLGEDAMKKIFSKKIIVFGIGGVGSWCAESLLRSGLSYITIVDCDKISLSNINRQIQATSKTIGLSKTTALKSRLLDINPDAKIMEICELYNKENHEKFEIHKYDYIIDCIDSLSNKINLIREASKLDSVFLSSMGASLKIDPTRVRVGKFWDIKGCPFAAIIRKRIRKGELPAKDFYCVYSDEVIENSSILPDLDSEGNKSLYKKAIINGTIAHITAIFGFTLAGIVIKDICER